MTPCILCNQHFFKHYEMKSVLKAAILVCTLISAADGWKQIIHTSESFSEK